MKKSRKPILYILLCAAVLLGLAVWLIHGNTVIRQTEITVHSEALPEEFAGFRIAHVSDLHSAEFGGDNQRLLSMLRAARPDIIAITGDIISSYHVDLEPALHFAREAAKIAPCYYVTGNHEGRISLFPSLQAGLMEAGVTILRREAVTIERNGASIAIWGLEDPRFNPYEGIFLRKGWDIQGQLEVLTESAGSEGFTLLLSHRPEYFETYCDFGVELVLSGHVHGGQIRLPFIGAIYGPDQGLFPEFDAGLYTAGGTNMIVSRGLGNSSFPIRVNNPPELIIVELQR